MVFSQLLLIAFVFQWLIGQYNNEKSELKKDLSLQFEKSEREIIDTLLEKNFITPLLKDKKGFKVSLQEEAGDSLSGSGKVKMYINKRETYDSTELVTIISDSLHPGINESDSALSDSAKNLLLHGVRLIVKEFSSRSIHQQEFEHKIFSSADTMLLKKYFEQQYKERGRNFDAHWINSDTSVHLNNDKTIYFQSSIFPKTYTLGIENFRLYLFKQIVPQFSFALILLFLTSFAFIIAHNTLKKQMQLNMMKNDFIDNISHELKTPLATVKVVIEALQNENIRSDENKIKEYLHMASLELNRLELLTGKVLSTSMMENGIITFEKQKIDLTKLITDLIFTMKVRLLNEGAVIIFDNQPEEFIITGDPIHIQGAMLNILDNSLKYAIPLPVINISIHKFDGTILVNIKDNGPGVPSEYQNKIFEKFFRVTTGNVHNVKGHGLGLSYASMVMKVHGGNISLKNNTEGGCTFSLIFKESLIPSS